MNESPKNFAIGLTGSIGSGCTTIAKALEKHGFKRMPISDPIKGKFRELYPSKDPTKDSFGENWRYELQNIGNDGRKGKYIEESTRQDRQKYHDYWVKLVLKNIDESYCGDVVIDGIRNLGEVETLRKTFPQGYFWLVAAHADYAMRWKRIQELNLYPNEKLFKRDDTRDSDEDDPAGQNVKQCVYTADYVLRNDAPLKPTSAVEEILAKKLLDQISVMKGEVSRNPRMAEVFMATAVSQSHASQCLKRKVGALIVDEENNIPLSVGYNDNPIGMESCFSLYNGLCYKDMVMESKLEKMNPFFCPECGKEHRIARPPWKCDGTKSDETPCICNFKLKFFPSRNIELCTAIHAEERAIRSLGQRRAEGCTMYVNTFPCFQCARHIKDAGIAKVVYIEAYPIEEAVQYLQDNKVHFEPFEGFKPRVFNQVFRQIE